jgi:hypothetical protein
MLRSVWIKKSHHPEKEEEKKKQETQNSLRVVS